MPAFFPRTEAGFPERFMHGFLVRSGSAKAALVERLWATARGMARIRQRANQCPISPIADIKRGAEVIARMATKPNPIHRQAQAVLRRPVEPARGADPKPRYGLVEPW